MLTNTFIHIQSIGAITEQRLWESGIRDWESIDGNFPIPVSPLRKHFLLSGIEESRLHLANRNPAYFSKKLPSNQSWRLLGSLAPIFALIIQVYRSNRKLFQIPR